jgi:Ca-activated chloride channel family protein
MMIDFATPQWFALSLILPFLAGLKWWSRSRAAAAVDGIVAKRLQAQLVKRPPWWVDWTGFGLQLLAILAFITALARPQWGFHQIETSTSERNIFLAIDTSRSMLAEDVQPNRLERAKLLAQDLVRNLPADRLGVIAFAGKAFIQAPLTIDHDAVIETIAQLDVEVIPRGGTNLTGPALLAIESLRDTENSLAALLLFSDGEDLEGEKDRAQLTRQITDSKLLIISIGAGTTAGGIIPDPENPGSFLKDESGQIVRTRLNPAALRELSEVSGGVYVDMGSESSVTTVVQQALRKLESARLRAEDVRVPHERYAIPLTAGMILLLLSHLWPNLTGLVRQPKRIAKQVSAAFIPLVAVLAPTGDQANAQSASPIDALQAYRIGKFSEAQELFTAISSQTPLTLAREYCQFGIGAAAYRAGDFETAKESFGQALLTRDRSLREKSHYNLANALFESGRLLAPTERDSAKTQWEAALTHYNLALALNAGNAAARQNHQFVEELLKQMANEPPPEEKKPDQEKQKEPENPEPKEPEKPQPPQEPNPPKPEDKPPEPEKPAQPQKKEEPPPSPGDSAEPPPQPRPWNPAQARQILEQNAGEDLKAKPAQVVPYSSQPFQNW